VMKLKRRLRWPGMTSHSMRSRASFTIEWTNWDGSLRTGESTLLNKDGSAYLCLLSGGIGGGQGTSFTPCMPLMATRVSIACMTALKMHGKDSSHLGRWILFSGHKC
jgi:hypothetical protein